MKARHIRFFTPPAALGAALVALLPMTASVAHPDMQPPPASTGSPKASSGKGSCGSCGGGDRQGPSGDELRQRAQRAAQRGTEDIGGITLGSGGRPSEDLTGAIAQLGETMKANAPTDPSAAVADYMNAASGWIDRQVEAQVDRKVSKGILDLGLKALDATTPPPSPRPPAAAATTVRTDEGYGPDIPAILTGNVLSDEDLAAAADGDIGAIVYVAGMGASLAGEGDHAPPPAANPGPEHSPPRPNLAPPAQPSASAASPLSGTVEASLLPPPPEPYATPPGPEDTTAEAPTPETSSEPAATPQPASPPEDELDGFKTFDRRQ